MTTNGPHHWLRNRMIWFQVDRVALQVCTAEAVPEQEWTDFLIASHRAVHDGGVQPVASLVYYREPPDAVLRKATVEFSKANNVADFKRIALLTDSTILRGAMTAMGWVTQWPMKAFSMTSGRESFEWVAEIEPFRIDVGLELFKKAAAELGVSFR